MRLNVLLFLTHTQTTNNNYDYDDAFTVLLSELSAVDFGSIGWAGHRWGGFLLYGLVFVGLFITIFHHLVGAIKLWLIIELLCRTPNFIWGFRSTKILAIKISLIYLQQDSNLVLCFHILALTCGICVALLFFCSIISRNELIFRQQSSLLQQTSLFPLLPLFQNDLRIRQK